LKLAGNTLFPFQLQDGVIKGSNCLANSGTSISLREYTLAMPGDVSASQANGPWKLTITDNVTNNQSGFLVAWNLEIQGLR